MEYLCLLYKSDKYKVRVYFNINDNDVQKKINQVTKNPKLTLKFAKALEAIARNIQTTSQYNWEYNSKTKGPVHAIKVDEHRFYSINLIVEGYREIYIYRYGRKQSQTNTKKLTTTIKLIDNIILEKYSEI